jgi:hypothetical protein
MGEDEIAAMVKQSSTVATWLGDEIPLNGAELLAG